MCANSHYIILVDGHPDVNMFRRLQQRPRKTWAKTSRAPVNTFAHRLHRHQWRKVSYLMLLKDSRLEPYAMAGENVGYSNRESSKYFLRINFNRTTTTCRTHLSSPDKILQTDIILTQFRWAFAYQPVHILCSASSSHLLTWAIPMLPS